jgi:hypothetical protein
MRSIAFSLVCLLVLMARGVAEGTDAAALAPLVQSAPAADGRCPSPCDECCHGCKECCVPTPAKKKIEKVVYGCKCVEFCVPKCPGIRVCHEKDCNGCEVPLAPNCGPVRTKIVLIKKVEVKESNTCVCVPPRSAQR